MVGFTSVSLGPHGTVWLKTGAAVSWTGADLSGVAGVEVSESKVANVG